MTGVGMNAKGMDVVQVVVQPCLSHYSVGSHQWDLGCSHSCVPQLCTEFMAWEGKTGFGLERKRKNPINLSVRNIHRPFPTSSQGITGIQLCCLSSFTPPVQQDHPMGSWICRFPQPLPRAAIRIFTKPQQHVQIIYILFFMEGREKVVLEVIIRFGFPICGGGASVEAPPCPTMPEVRWVSRFLRSSDCRCHITGHLSPEKHSSIIQTATQSSGF